MSHTPQRIKLSRQISEQMAADTVRYPPPDGFVDSDDSHPDDDADTVRWALRGHWLVDHLSERTLPDGRCVLELVEEDIFAMPDATLDEYVDAVDAAMQRDSSWGAL
jgi:hypothetical protein